MQTAVQSKNHCSKIIMER